MQTLNNIIEGKFRSGNQSYDMKEIWYSPDGTTKTQVWPPTFRYVIESVTVRYTNATTFDGVTCIPCNGNGNAYASGLIRKYRGDTLIDSFRSDLLPIEIERNPWVSPNGQSEPLLKISGQVVLGTDLKAYADNSGFSVTVVWSYQGLATAKADVKHAGNRRGNGTYGSPTFVNYRVELNDTDFTHDGGTTTVNGIITQVHTKYYTWTSQTVTADAPEQFETAALSSVTVSPSTGVQISGNQITFPPNAQSDEIVYAVTGRYSNYSATAYAYVYGVDTGHTYSNLSISATYGSDISAAGGAAYPVISVSIRQDGVTLTGSCGNGETICNVSNSGGTRSTTVIISYSGGENGYLSAPPRGEVEGARRQIGSTTITANKGTLYSNSVTASAWQAANVITQHGSFTVSAMSIVPVVNGEELEAEGGVFQLRTPLLSSVFVKVIASGNGTKDVYSSGAGGQTISLNNETVVPNSLTVTSGGASVTVTDQVFSAENKHTLNGKTYSISATFQGTNRQASILQQADEKVDAQAEYHVSLSEVANSNSIWAGGGSVLLEASAYHTTGKKWASDNTPVTGESTTTYDISSITLAMTSGSGAFEAVTESTGATAKTFRITHRDMKTTAGTDSISIYAKNGNNADTSANPYTTSATNALDTSHTYEEVGDTVWGESYTENDNYNISLAVDAYDSDTAPAPFLGATTSYRVSAYHRVAVYHDGTQTTNYWQRYSSWIAEHDDAEHKSLVDSEVTNYNHVFVSASTAFGDSYSVTRPAAYTWVTINETSQTITFAAQVDTEQGTPQRSVYITATNTSDPATTKAKASKHLWQQAYQKLTVSPLRYDFDWDELEPVNFNVRAYYVQFKVSIVSEWISVLISFDGGITFTAVDQNTKYGIVTGAQYPILRVAPLTRNDPNFNPTGYRQARLAQVTLTPQDTTGVASVMLRLEQAKYDGGLPTD